MEDNKILDPLAGLMDTDSDTVEEAAEVAEDIVEDDDIDCECEDCCADDDNDDDDEIERVPSILDKIAPVVRNVWQTVSKPFRVSVPNKAVVYTICGVAFAAVMAVIGLFWYGTAYNRSTGISIEDWQEKFNAVTYTDVTSSDYGVRFTFATMLSNTDHTQITDEDIAALKRGEEVKIFGGDLTLKAEIRGDEIMSLSAHIDYDEFTDKYLSATDHYNDLGYSGIDMRYFTYLGNVLNAFNSEQSTAYDNVALFYGAKSWSTSVDRKYYYDSAYDSDTENFRCYFDTLNYGVDVVVLREHFYYPNWSAITQYFPEKTEETPEPSVDNTVTASDLSASDVSASDVSATDA